MSQISAADVMKLRDKTGVQMMKCKEALIAVGGDFEKAVQYIRERNKDVANRPDRVASEGRIGVHLDPSGKGGIVEVRCESAPVAKTDQFIQLANDLAHQVASKGAAPAAELTAQPFVGDPTLTIKERISEVVALMRENVEIPRCAQLKGTLGSYVHHDGSVGVLLQVEGTPSDPQVLRDVCMHVAARAPLAALQEHVSKDQLAKEMEIARAQAAEQGKGKPASIVEKIAEGKLKTWLAENVLNEQPFVKDDKQTVGEVLKKAGVKLVTFVRYRVGEVSK